MKIKHFPLLFLLFLIIASCDNSDEQFVEKLVYEFRTKSINRDKINWEIFHEKVKESFRISKDSAITTALTLNNNRHSYYYIPGKPPLKGHYKDSLSSDSCVAFGTLAIEKSSRIGYLRIKSFFGNPNDINESRQNSVKYIDDIIDSLISYDRRSLKGWVIDLRFNYGGDMWPMLVALSPFLNSGSLGSFRLESSNEIWEKKDNEIFLNGSSQNRRVYNGKVSYVLKNKNVRIAILIGKMTQSAGEATAIAFKSLPNTRFFGLTTKGLATSNRPINMGNNEVLVLTTGFMCDVHGKRYPKGVSPDIFTCGSRQLNDSVMNWFNIAG